MGGAYLTKFTNKNVGSHGSIILQNSLVFDGTQALGIIKASTADTDNFIVVLLAKTRPGYQHWWDFKIDIPAPTTTRSRLNITVTQDYLPTRRGQDDLCAVRGVVCDDGLEFRCRLSPGAVRERFRRVRAEPPGTPPGAFRSIQRSAQRLVQHDLQHDNHGFAKCPAWADHVFLEIDLTGIDNAATCGTTLSAAVDKVRCWKLIMTRRPKMTFTANVLVPTQVLPRRGRDAAVCRRRVRSSW